MLWFDNGITFESSFITIVFFIVFGSIAFSLIKAIVTWSINNQSQTLTVPAKVVSKRTNIRGGTNNSAAYTSYFITFEERHGERQEFKVKGRDFGQLVEGDIGFITFQGTRFHTFERQKRESSD
ncbi:DUF2500 domain-containing protein [Lysinibacillus fusiformis]|jgi:hypothetical protein|uniref:DUF2500 domain-containing protein n=1 Tax=Lysinibacillus TaxID=400634 RepID=UPI0004D61854|nr:MULTISPECIES: DUF2500 domain-containing protein [Lysinibacillus]AXQ50698.1 DUF2500 domain-containing protein [Stenotrophomonas rhizophila]MDC6269446.1 DUF2500 domain-containing protein [Lysinibacillus sphaericus]AJK86161.1 hypothetical protein HR49_02485 [Lysinibacillus fusiformis]KAB0445511.1 DUF2500 domain-containing protein [Lysinibacillus fusiformis]KGA81802.1 hypothetical protein KQ41_13900 [Lysinibacillus fusiformis]